ncbi:hypothetical protein CS542_02970 [Pedobacter sp. IW39]|nr:hypothetical protein CS542_02970 [Pedobacter sp. IW39]
MLLLKVLFDYYSRCLANRTAAYLEQNLATFSISDTDYKDFVKFIQSKNIVIDPKQLAAAKPVIYSDLKALLCKYHLGKLVIIALNLNDSMVKQAISSVRK